MFKIGDFSRLCRVPVSALRYYADIDLLQPNHIDPFTGYRYYSLDQLPRLNRMLALRDLDFSLDQIKQIMSEDLSVDTLRGMLMMKQQEIDARIQDDQARLARVAARLNQLAKEGKMTDQEVILKSIDAMRVLSVRQVVPSGEHVGLLLGAAAMAAVSQGVMPSAPPFTIFHDSDFKEADLDVEIVLPVSGTTPDTIPLDDARALSAGLLPGVASAACLVHTGGFDTLPEAYAVLGRWIEQNGCQINGPAREVYLRPPSEAELPITEIQFPVKRA